MEIYLLRHGAAEPRGSSMADRNRAPQSSVRGIVNPPRGVLGWMITPQLAGSDK